MRNIVPWILITNAAGCSSDPGAPDAATGAPRVVLATPADGTTEVPADTRITVVFDRLMDVASLDPASFTLVDDSGAPVAAAVAAWPTGGVLTPAAPLAIDRTYTATVTTAVTDDVGTPVAADVSWSFATHRRAWSALEALASGPRDGVAYADVAIDSDGRATAVWHQWNGGRSDIWTTQYLPGAGWGPPIRVELDDAGNAYSPQVVIDGDGGTLVVWSQSDGVVFDVRSQRRDPATGWSLPASVEYASTNAVWPDLAVDPAGDAVVVFGQWDGSRWDVWANRRSGSCCWLDATRIETDDGDAWNQTVAAGAGGTAVAVWTVDDGTRGSVWANVLDPDSGWGTATPVETQDGEAFSPRVAVDGAGAAIAVWAQYDGIWANRFVPGAGWGTAELVDFSDGYEPQIALGPDGEGVVVWTELDGVVARRFAPDSGWADSQLILAGAGRPQLAMAADGSALVVASTGWDLVSARMLPAGGWQAPETIESEGGNISVTAVAISGTGDAVVVSRVEDQVSNSVWASVRR